MDVEGGDLGRKNEHHLDVANLDDFSAGERVGVTSLEWLVIHLGTVAAFDTKEPPLILGLERDGSVFTRHHLAGAQINVYLVIVVGSGGGGVGCMRGFGCSADIHDQLGDVKGPVLGSNLGVGLDSVPVGLMDSICVVFTGLYRLVPEVLCDLGHQLVAVGRGGFFLFLDLRERLSCQRERAGKAEAAIKAGRSQIVVSFATYLLATLCWAGR